MSATAFDVSLDGIINTQNHGPGEHQLQIPAEKWLTWTTLQVVRRTEVYIRFLYKVDVRSCCALLKNVLNSRNDSGLPADGASAADGVGCCLAFLPVAGCRWLYTRTKLIHIHSHTHSHTHRDIKYYWAKRKANQPSYWWSISHVYVNRFIVSDC